MQTRKYRGRARNGLGEGLFKCERWRKGGGQEGKGPQTDGGGEGWLGEGKRGRAEIEEKTEDLGEKRKLHDNAGDEFPGVICLSSWKKILKNNKNYSRYLSWLLIFASWTNTEV